MKWLALRLGGQKWGVYLVPAKSKNLLTDGGELAHEIVDYERSRIYVSRALGSEARDEALLHALVHALLYVTGAEEAYDGDAKVDELIVKALTPTLHRLLIDLGFRFPKGTAA